LSELARLREMKRRITTAMESVGTNFPPPKLRKMPSALLTSPPLGRRSLFCRAQVAGSRPAGAFAGRLAGTDVATRRATRAAPSRRAPVSGRAVDALPGAAARARPIVLAGALVNVPPLFLAGWPRASLPTTGTSLPSGGSSSGCPCLCFGSASSASRSRSLRVGRGRLVTCFLRSRP